MRGSTFYVQRCRLQVRKLKVRGSRFKVQGSRFEVEAYEGTRVREYECTGDERRGRTSEVRGRCRCRPATGDGGRGMESREPSAWRRVPRHTEETGKRERKHEGVRGYEGRNVRRTRAKGRSPRAAKEDRGRRTESHCLTLSLSNSACTMRRLALPSPYGFTAEAMAA